MKIVFLGGGNMANALIGGMVKQGFAASDIDVIDLGADARTKLSESYGVICHASAETAPASPDILVLAVKPQQMKEAVAPLVDKLGNALVISIAAGLDMAALSRWLGGHRTIVRCMPITGIWSAICAPMNAWACRRFRCAPMAARSAATIPMNS